MNVTLTAAGCVAALRTPYHQSFVADLKSRVPAWARAWDGRAKAWLIDPVHVPTVVALCQQTFGVTLTPPTLRAPETVVAEAWYIARPKEGAAYGMDRRREWRYAIDESALRAWFGAPTDAAENVAPDTLYAVIGVAETADEETIKRAIKRALLQWHPDRCTEPDAAERTWQIIEARDILLNAQLRARYDAGLRVERRIAQRQKEQQAPDDWRPPLRSGVIVGQGYALGDKIRVVSIEAWDDVLDAAGRTLVASWRYGEKGPSFTWA